MKKLLLIIPLVLLLFGVKMGMSQTCPIAPSNDMQVGWQTYYCGFGFAANSTNNNQPVITFDKCTGNITITKLKFREDNPVRYDDWLVYTAIFIEIDGVEHEVWRMGSPFDPYGTATYKDRGSESELSSTTNDGYLFSRAKHLQINRIGVYGNAMNFSYSIGNRIDETFTFGTNSQNKYVWYLTMNITNYNSLPSTMFKNGQLKIRIESRMHNSCGDRNTVYGNTPEYYGNGTQNNDQNDIQTDFKFCLDKTQTFNTTIAPPSNLVASKNECNKIKLSWTNATQTWNNGLCGATHRLKLYRNNQEIADLADNIITYDDVLSANVAANTDYNYTIAAYYDLPIGPLQLSNKVAASTTGSFYKPSLPDNFSLNVSETNCNGNVTLTWDGATTNTAIDKWTVFRSINGVNYDSILDLVGSAKQYIDVGRNTNTTYWYKLVAKNCNGSSPAAVASIFVLGKPGIAEPLSAENNNALAKITFKWIPTSNATSYIVLKTPIGVAGITEPIPVAGNLTSYEDLSVASCVPYKYQIRAKNLCTDEIDPISPNFRIDTLLPDITTAFDTISNKLRVSKGFYSDRVQLEWSNKFQFQIDAYRIERKVANGGTYAIIATVNNSSNIYIDNSALPNTMYNYKITGFSQCAGGTNSTNSSEDIGFRSPFGLISGSITYSGGTAVKGVKVTASSTQGAAGTSLLFNNTGTDSAVSIASNNVGDINLDTGFTVECWVRPSNMSTGDRRIIDIKLATGSNKNRISITHNTTTLFYSMVNSDGSVMMIRSVPLALTNITYSQITLTMRNKYLFIYVNGTIRDSMSLGNFTALPMSDCIAVFGKGFIGHIDEVRIWNYGKTAKDVINDFNRFVAPQEDGLEAYWSFDENLISTANKTFFDQSKTNDIYNENHGKFFTNSTQWSNIIPGNTLLSNASYTDAQGNYLITNIKYTGSGQTYTVTPNYSSSGEAHKFIPNTNVVYIGDGSAVINANNFTDDSKFIVTGTVVYAGTDSCPVKDVIIKIDGNPVVKQGNINKTDADGKYTVEMPIGRHTISVEKLDHVFSVGSLVDYEFLGPQVVNFRDSTLVKVVGRVVGGSRELNKVANLRRSKNNIGKARIVFQVSNCTKNYTIFTSDTTGEYTAYLPPLDYIVSYNITSFNYNLTNPIFGNANKLDLQVVPSIINIVDTFTLKVNDDSTFRRVDRTWYQTRFDVKYYTTPQIYVTKTATPKGTPINNFVGETILSINGVNTNIDNGAFDYPVFLQDKYYNANINVVENYENWDKNPVIKDSVPVDGILNITRNGLAIPSDNSLLNIPLKDGFYQYGFRAGAPNQLVNTTTPQYSYTSLLQISYIPPVGSSATWLPNTENNLPKEFRGYVFGARSGGANFTTSGPALVDLILRDPPGTLSYASWQAGKSRTTTTTSSLLQGETSTFEAKILLGGKITTQVGVPGATVETEIAASFNAGLGLNTSYSVNNQGELVESISNTTTISTSGDPGKVGAGYDLFYGKATNIIFGLSDNLRLMDTTTCRIKKALNDNKDVCYGKVFNGHQVGLSQGFFMVPGEVKTTFIYTANEIEQIVIPSLVDLRNEILKSGNKNKNNVIKYTSKYTNTADPDYKLKYASNNDDPIWGSFRSSASPFSAEKEDAKGLSYEFKADSVGEVDSIRYFNNQIRLWKNALARNEREKHQIFRDTGILAEAGGKNISIGESSFQQDFTSENTQTNTETIELQLGPFVSTEFETTINDIGVGGSGSLTYNRNTSSTNSTSSANSTTLTYFLKDGDAGDLISVDVVDGKKGDGHIFRLRAGRTSCPYEDAVRAKYFDPNNDTITATTRVDNGVILSAATAKREVPKLDATPAVLYNVPAKEAGVFTLELGNLSESKQDMTYALRVIETSNPHGAIIKVDGLDPNRSFNVPFGATSQKTLTVERGSLKYDYDNIQLILKSTCDETIFDTVSFSIKFIPTCTNASMITPDDRWVLNNSFKDTFPVVIGNYNYNFGGFDNVKFQYRPASSSVWLNQQAFNIDTANLVTTGKKIKIPIGQPYISYSWITDAITDGNYEIRSVSECKAPGYPNAFVYSPVLQGVIDRVNPAPFGTPSPGDGILDPNDDISIQFNEPIDNSSLTQGNFDMRGVLNGSNLQTNTSLFFDADNDFMELPNGINLANKAFTIELLAKRGTLGTEQCLVSQGIDATQNFWFGFNQNNQLVFKVGNESVVTNPINPLTNQSSFSNYAVSYNPINNEVFLYENGVLKNTGSVNLYSNYQGAGKVFVGKSSQGNANFFNGNLLELRIWSVERTPAQIQANLKNTLNGKEVGILGNWRIDEAEGLTVRDYVRNRTGLITGATWQITPVGRSYSFDGVDDYVTTTTNNMAISKEMDFSIEFWVKSNQSTAATLLSNGKGDSTNGGITWTIEKTATGTLVFKHFGSTYTIVEGGLFDNTWHHVALVMQRNSTLTSYLDGNLQKSYLASFFNELSGPRISIGGRNWLNENNNQIVYDNFFNGKIDEVRFWDVARTQELVRRDKLNRLAGQEPGLRLYLPFELYTVDPTGVAILSPSINDVADATHVSASAGGAIHSIETPTIKLPRQVQSIAFTYAINNDKIILTPTVDPAFIENVTLDVSVRNVKDLRGNRMQSPKTWIAYINKNQVKWSDNEVSFQKVTLGALSFTASIINTGGALKTYNIQNLPAWLTASAPTGTVSPNSTKLITFTVNPTVNIGSYEEALSLITDFGYPEKLVVKLKVYANEPNWSLNSEKYANSMSVIGQLKIGNVISSNTDDILAAFVDGECRGKAKVQYYSSLDKYFVFLDIFGDTNNKTISFKIWNASEGKMHDDVIPYLTFIGNDLQGSINNPIVFNADDKLSRIIPLKDGWNWLSVNLLTKDSNNLNKLFRNLKLEGGEVVRGQSTISDFNIGKGWLGSLSKPSEGFKVTQSYRFRSNGIDTLILSGVEANPLDQIISAQIGWNWIGFISQRNMEINEAFSTFTPASGDLLKSQNSFAIYDSIIGWVGSLNTLRPNLGYMYKAKAPINITYPRFGMLGKKTTEVETVLSQRWQVDYHKYANNMNIIAQLDLCKDMQADGALLLGAFVNNELRGLCKAVMVDNKLQYYLTIAGDVENETVEFYLMDENTGKTNICNETTSFVSNSLLGLVSKSMLLTSSNKFECTVSSKVNEMEVKVYPNPTTQTDLLKLSINLPKQQEVTIEVFDIKGQQIHAIPTVLLSKGIQIISVFEGHHNITSGVYIIKVKTDDTVKQIKFIQQ